MQNSINKTIKLLLLELVYHEQNIQYYHLNLHKDHTFE